MSDDFQRLIAEIEAEAKAEGPAAEAELRDLRRTTTAYMNPLAISHRLRSRAYTFLRESTELSTEKIGNQQSRSPWNLVRLR